MPSTARWARTRSACPRPSHPLCECVIPNRSLEAPVFHWWAWRRIVGPGRILGCVQESKACVSSKQPQAGKGTCGWVRAGGLSCEESGFEHRLAEGDEAEQGEEEDSLAGLAEEEGVFHDGSRDSRVVRSHAYATRTQETTGVPTLAIDRSTSVSHARRGVNVSERCARGCGQGQGAVGGQHDASHASINVAHVHARVDRIGWPRTRAARGCLASTGVPAGGRRAEWPSAGRHVMDHAAPAASRVHAGL